MHARSATNSLKKRLRIVHVVQPDTQRKQHPWPAALRNSPPHLCAENVQKTVVCSRLTTRFARAHRPPTQGSLLQSMQYCALALLPCAMPTKCLSPTKIKPMRGQQRGGKHERKYGQGTHVVHQEEELVSPVGGGDKYTLLSKLHPTLLNRPSSRIAKKARKFPIFQTINLLDNSPPPSLTSLLMGSTPSPFQYGLWNMMAEYPVLAAWTRRHS